MPSAVFLMCVLSATSRMDDGKSSGRMDWKDVVGCELGLGDCDAVSGVSGVSGVSDGHWWR